MYDIYVFDYYYYIVVVVFGETEATIDWNSNLDARDDGANVSLTLAAAAAARWKTREKRAESVTTHARDLNYPYVLHVPKEP